ncbi:hypothetical protein NEMIN01_0698 [Nematocida minor]|uniref:uncharacterized protein n=1 Tax=Nematocida minor TaxID=1912983 RepID=UPI00221FD746|nr:uncharacterized protein NEMIN01_0698 [Nematocida minor]KAI5189835.1 hypothetical protein NEMIN01_0698 [Nematocida minor]
MANKNKVEIEESSSDNDIAFKLESLGRKKLKMGYGETAEDDLNALIRIKKYERVTDKGVTLIKRMSFSLPKGKTIALLGLSGDGKTTLMESLIGYCNPSHTTYGEVYVRNAEGALVKRDVKEWFPRVNYVEQSAINYKGIPLKSILCSIANCNGKKSREVDEYIELMKLTKSKNVLFKNLSGGEQRRAMVIAGILSKKDFNIWDEPLTGLDSEMARTVMKAIKQANTTNLVTVHQISDDLMKLFDNVLLMHKSTIIYSGPAASMKDYFTTKGIDFPHDIFHINYLMRLCAQNSDNDRDTKNIETFNGIADAILNKTMGPLAGKNILYTDTLRNVSFVNVFEILKRLTYFDKGFKGFNFILNVFCPLVIMIPSLLYMVNVFLHIGPEEGRFNFHGGKSYLVLMDILISIKSRLTPAELQDTKLLGALNTLISATCNFTFMNSLISSLFMFIFGIIFYATCLPSNFLNTNFYRLCKSNIKNNQITVGDFIVAQSIDIFFKKTLTIWMSQILLYYVLYRYIDVDVKQYTTVGHTLYISIMFLFSLLLSFYSLALNLAPFPTKLFSIFSGLIMAFLTLFPYFLYNVSTFYHYDASFLTTTNLYDAEVPDLVKYIIANISPSASESGKYDNLVKYIVCAARYLTTISPRYFFEVTLQKIFLYNRSVQKNFSSGDIDKDSVTKIMEKIDVLLSESDKLKDDPRSMALRPYNDRAEYFKDCISDICGGIEPHEIFNRKESLEDISILRVVWDTACYWRLPIILLCLTIVYSVRYLQPRLRN